jgi:hypothetical protein
VFLLVCVPSATAEENQKIWSPGDIIQVGVICKDEETILQIVNADMKSEELVLVTMNQMIIMGLCAGIPSPMFFVVQKSLVSYTDHIERQSLVLGVGNSENQFLGWVLANGKWSLKKKKGQQINLQNSI